MIASSYTYPLTGRRSTQQIPNETEVGRAQNRRVEITAI
jgi:flagellar motor protein MotB